MGEERRLVAIAVDTSPFAEYAFDWYVKYLHRPENAILAIHVPEGFDADKIQKEMAKAGQLKQSTEKIYSKITELEERYRYKITEAKIQGTVLSVPHKQAGSVIIDIAKEEKAFCIVMGTRGRSTIKKVVLGSVSDYVVKNSEIPVIVVRSKPNNSDE